MYDAPIVELNRIVSLLISRGLRITRFDGGQTLSKYFLETARGASS
jgi:hypothetical protein